MARHPKNHEDLSYLRIDESISTLINSRGEGGKESKEAIDKVFRDFGWSHPFEAYSPESSRILRVAFIEGLPRNDLRRFANAQYKAIKGVDNLIETQKRIDRHKSKAPAGAIPDFSDARANLLHSNSIAAVNNINDARLAADYEDNQQVMLKDPGLKNVRERLNRAYRAGGWDHPFEAFSDESSPQHRGAFMLDLTGGGKETPRFKRFAIHHDELVKEYNKILKVEDKWFDEHANLVDRINDLPKGWILGRRYSGLSSEQQGALDALANGVQVAFQTSIINQIRNRAIEVGRKNGRLKPGVTEDKSFEGKEFGTPIHMWAADQCHTYFISEQLFESLMDTEIRGEFSLTEIPWIMESFAIVFPKPLRVWMMDADGSGGEDSDVLAIVLGLPKHPKIPHGSRNITSRLKIEGFDKEIDAVPNVPCVTLITRTGYGTIDDADKLDLPTKSFLFALLFASMNKPELVEKGKRIDQPGRPSNQKRVNNIPNIPSWTPNYLGRTYQIPDRSNEPGGGIDGRKVRRKRKAHMKQQPHGPNRSLRKWILVEAYWAGSIEI